MCVTGMKDSGTDRLHSLLFLFYMYVMKAISVVCQ